MAERAEFLLRTEKAGPKGHWAPALGERQKF